MSILHTIFASTHVKYLKKLHPIVDKINSLEETFEKLSDGQLREKTDTFKKKIHEGKQGDALLPEAFALMREASKRTLGQRPFDVQLMGGIVLHQGDIAEMKTGEGKTLAATLPAYLNALEGKGVHVVTVNDYLAKRDMVWMGQIYYLLGLAVGCIAHEQAFLYDPTYREEEESRDRERDATGGFQVIESYLRPVSRKEAYAADVTYGTNNEFGFDYLRDNMAYDAVQYAQRGFHYAIIDEVDSILIDEARTPLIISGPSDESTEKYYQFVQLIASLKEQEDFVIDEKMHTASFTEKGQDRIVRTLSSDPWAENDIQTTHQLVAALRARTLFQRDKDYVVKDGNIMIVDEFTGRLLPGRRYSGGLHQAIEAKEKVEVKAESRTLASITFQNYFRMYDKIAGMTGTALTSTEEFNKVYGLEVVVIPTNKPMVREELHDRIYKTVQGKFQALVREIKERHEKGQPVLVGTVSIEKNEYLGKLLSREGVPHRILNAKHHEEEGTIIAQTGKPGAVTIATNMAGRGVDIVLGGNPPDPVAAKKVVALGGLHVIGTERHEARRIDNQLRGRSGRQGDPGSSQFFVSLEDDLMRIFGGEKIQSLMQTFKIPEDQPIEAKMISRAIESAQSKIEGMHFDLRKHVLEYDDIMNKHREVFYRKRRTILEKAQQGELKGHVAEILKKVGYSEEKYAKKEEEVGHEQMRQAEKVICLRVLDTLWVEHLENMEHVRDSVRLRAYGQQDPLIEYKKEGHRLFLELQEAIDRTITSSLMNVNVQPTTNTNTSAQVQEHRPAVQSQYPASHLPSKNKKVGRNDPCPCNSGKKYTKCHGK